MGDEQVISRWEIVYLGATLLAEREEHIQPSPGETENKSRKMRTHIRRYCRSYRNKDARIKIILLFF